MDSGVDFVNTSYHLAPKYKALVLSFMFSFLRGVNFYKVEVLDNKEFLKIFFYFVTHDRNSQKINENRYIISFFHYVFDRRSTHYQKPIPGYSLGGMIPEEDLKKHIFDKLYDDTWLLKLEAYVKYFSYHILIHSSLNKERLFSMIYMYIFIKTFYKKKFDKLCDPKVLFHKETFVTYSVESLFNRSSYQHNKTLTEKDFGFSVEITQSQQEKYISFLSVAASNHAHLNLMGLNESECRKRLIEFLDDTLSKWSFL
jgi:hypothetical protein